MKHILETLFLVIKICIGFTTEVIWMAITSVSLADYLRVVADAFCYRFIHSGSVLIYIFCFHYKQRASKRRNVSATALR